MKDGFEGTACGMGKDGGECGVGGSVDAVCALEGEEGGEVGEDVGVEFHLYHHHHIQLGWEQNMRRHT